jgi:hypothetical protein
VALRNGSAPGPELFTVEVSHGKPRLTGPRPTDLETVPTGYDRERDQDGRGRFTSGNKAAVGRGARKAIRAPYDAAKERISEALEKHPDVEPAVADVLLRDALLIFNACRAELGTRSVWAQGPTVAYAIETTLAGYYMQEAAAAGFLTERGEHLHDRAMACETQAARAMTAALAATKALARKTRQSSAMQRIEREAEELIEAQGQTLEGEDT